MAISVLLADDHHVVVAGYRAVLEREPDLRIVGEATDGREVLPSVFRLQPDVLVLDLSMTGMHGLDVLRDLSRYAGTKVVVATMFDAMVYALEAFERGATGYVTKHVPSSELARAIREAAAGRRFVAPESLRQRLEELQSAEAGRPVERFDTLTDRERTVLRLVAEGRSNAEMASELSLSIRTVETHRKNMMTKMSFENQAALVRWACVAGIIVP
jgi:DNA-binding NarL/FixJ family response regulator